MARRTASPAGLGAAGRRLWSACLERDDGLTDSNNPMRHVLLEACKVADQLEKLAETEPVNLFGVGVWFFLG